MTYLTATDVATHLGKSARWVQNEARAGRLPHYRVGVSYRFTLDQVSAWLETTAVTPAPPTDTGWGRRSKGAVA